jgi:predicted Rossmann-fold nucleotide-binding protein
VGTFDEVFEEAALIHSGKIQAFPLVLVGRDFWDPLISHLAADVRDGATPDCTTSHFARLSR